MERIILLVTVALVMAATVALSGAALAQPGGAADVCVSIKGDTKVDRGDSFCSSDSTSKAVATTNDSFTFANDDSHARANNNSLAFAEGNCNVSANNREIETCP